MAVLSQKRLPARDLCVLFDSGAVGSFADAELLDRFIAEGDEAAFEAIIDRHGPMVWGVCRRILENHHHAEDAFQATFLVLAVKAASIVPRSNLSHWLYGVAYRTARKARAQNFKRRIKEAIVASVRVEDGSLATESGDVLAVLDEELARLPVKYRTPILLCDLEGKTHSQAAEQLGWPVGTVSGRLSRGRSKLAERLTRRGITTTAGALVLVLLHDSATAAAPRSLMSSTSRAARWFAGGKELAGVEISTKVFALADQILKGLIMNRITCVAAIAIAMAVVGAAGSGMIGMISRAEAPRFLNEAVSADSASVGAQAKGAADGPSAVLAKDELKRLEGTWALIDVVESGIPATADQKVKGLGRVVIKDAKLTLKPQYAPLSNATSFSIAVDPSKSPKIIGLLPLNEKMEEDDHRPIRLGIYELKGDTLRICAGADRPENFEAGPGSNRDLIVLKWAKW